MASVVAQHIEGNINCMDIQVLCICNRNKECCALESWFIKIVESGMNRDQGTLSSDHDCLVRKQKTITITTDEQLTANL